MTDLILLVHALWIAAATLWIWGIESRIREIEKANGTRPTDKNCT